MVSARRVGTLCGFRHLRSSEGWRQGGLRTKRPESTGASGAGVGQLVSYRAGKLGGMNEINSAETGPDQSAGQLELELAGGRRVPRPAGQTEATGRLERARWWFERMRRAVDQRLGWNPAPAFIPEQTWLPGMLTRYEWPEG